jgi:hypothetical protein
MSDVDVAAIFEGIRLQMWSDPCSRKGDRDVCSLESCLPCRFTMVRVALDQQQREIERLKAQHETDELVAQVHREEGVEARRVIMDRDVEIVQLRADLAAAQAALAQAIAEADVYRKAHKEERQRCEQAEQERDRLRDILTRRQNYAGDDRFGETR